MIKLIDMRLFRISFYRDRDLVLRRGHWCHRLCRVAVQIGRVRLEMGYGRPPRVYLRDRPRCFATVVVRGQGVALLPR
jgi:hypothetical protein